MGELGSHSALVYAYAQGEQTRKLSHLIRIQSELIYLLERMGSKEESRNICALLITPREAKDGKFLLV